MSSHRISPSLRFAIYDGIAWALMAGFGETFLSAYAIFLKASPTHLALLGAFPAFIPAISQTLGVRLMALVPSRRRIVTWTASLQALSWIPLAALGVFFASEQQAPLLLLLLASVYFFFAGLGVPAWSSLMGDLVPRDSRGAYFSLRNLKIGYATLAALIIAGPLLSAFQSAGHSALGFAVLFVIAAICRGNSAYWLSRYDDPVAEKTEHAYFSFFDFIRRTRHANFTKFVWFVSLITFGLSISAPFFSLFILRELKFSYGQFTTLSAAMIGAQILTLQHWGRLTDRFGNKAILFVAAPGVTFAPILWLVSHEFWWLFVLHLYSGFMWAGFNLAASNFLYDAVSPAKRARCAAYQSILNGTAMLSGALIGSYLLNHPFSYLHSYFSVGHRLDYYVLFVISALIRLTVVLFFWKLIKEVREVEAIAHRDLIFKVIQIKPLTGLSFGFDSKKRKESIEDN